MFVDEVEIVVKGGDGGDGIVAFLREKYRPWGGPAGGDGGNGGDVVLAASERPDTLYPLTRQARYLAPRGQPGQGKNKSGQKGEDLLLEVPAGTVCYDAVTGEQLCDLERAGKRVVVAKGGKGGRGNQHFATPSHQSPRRCEPGQPGQERRLRLVLKLIADVGLVGLPNAGKSTLLARVSAARPKIADYPFTTLNPKVGIVDSGDYRQLVMADLPGIIAGASQGAGLGLAFLRHLERTKFLLHVVDAAPLDGSDPVDHMRVVMKELAEYSPALAARPAMIAANKLDLTGAEANLARLKQAFDLEVVGISAATGKNIEALLRLLFAALRRLTLEKEPWS